MRIKWHFPLANKERVSASEKGWSPNQVDRHGAGEKCFTVASLRAPRPLRHPSLELAIINLITQPGESPDQQAASDGAFAVASTRRTSNRL
jgi:hypothetical protein